MPVRQQLLSRCPCLYCRRNCTSTANILSWFTRSGGYTTLDTIRIIWIALHDEVALEVRHVFNKPIEFVDAILSHQLSLDALWCDDRLSDTEACAVVGQLVAGEPLVMAWR